MPDSLSELERIVSFTAANTSLILFVLVACVRLCANEISATLTETNGFEYVLWVNAQLSFILLCKLPENKLGGLLHIWSAGVFTKVIGKRNLCGSQD